ncbi:MAG TPA: SDR family NAD(P)-dependent oxidoreductase [Thauera sp.]|uniref:SDR family NAD(P)-dependent oxidoreductase n=1 Tax=Thauera sp. TaxID=1905334 RepID=UPI002BA877D7|nr:SDR family NAD(P)-dependent oxidoreductase [Thauera sp.]HRP22978.1 SDR family NAD(P)-dependent oxidoreductase [Thauera sp.]HRP67763.1 SDR family NAD(P)-dependent oxidoreductase [Thauera sp.]
MTATTVIRATRGLFSPLNTPIRDWQGRRVWIVGASTGIGEALALALAARGARLALSARSVQRLQAVRAACVERGVAESDCVIEALDLARDGDFARAQGALLARWGGVDLVVFNAGTYRPLRAWELSAEAVRETVALNLVGTLCGVGELVPALLRQGSGAIALVGSVAGYGGLPKATVYGPTKAALINLAETLYLDLSPRGIDVFLIDPGFVATPLTAANDFHMPALQTPAQAAQAIVDGFARGDFEIHFPKRFTRVLKLLQWLPRRFYFPLVRRATGL